MEQGRRYQLSESCMLVDAKDCESQERYPKEIPFAHILDQRNKPFKYLKLSDGAAFIARFIVLGVDVALIPEILRSEYEHKEVDFEAAVRAVVEMLSKLGYIEERTFGIPYEPPEELGTGENESGYSLDFGVHSLGISVVKIPRPKFP